MSDLPVKHQRFVDAYIQSGVASEAAIAAGYSAKSAYSQGSKLLDDIHIAQEIEMRMEELRQAALQEARITREDVVKMLKEDRQRAIEAGQLGTALRAAELLGKSLGLFVDVRADTSDFSSMLKEAQAQTKKESQQKSH